MRYLTFGEVIRLHGRILASSGGAAGIRDVAIIESAIQQPRSTFDGAELYPELVQKAASLGFALVQGHGFIDGNKRIGHAAMEVFLVLNGFQVDETTDEQERLVLQVASGDATREELTSWLRERIQPVNSS
ncbi:MAG: type II toxin-antitoxin system death-on-curing family toxin [Polyangiaceae bacterium]|nr:type II toxin-antitoxin system death-on-curing family toxin [Polyangiaceae bacterium]